MLIVQFLLPELGESPQHLRASGLDQRGLSTDSSSASWAMLSLLYFSHPSSRSSCTTFLCEYRSAWHVGLGLFGVRLS